MSGSQPTEPAQGTPDGPTRTLFDAVLKPRRSLSPRGFRIMLAGVFACGLIVGTPFLSRGVWPVLPYFGLEIVLLYAAFRINYRSARGFEAVQLTPEALTVECVKPSGRTDRFRFQPPHWLRVTVEHRRGGGNSLRLSSHGRSITLGSFLTPGERLAFAADLRSALARLAASPAESTSS